MIDFTSAEQEINCNKEILIKKLSDFILTDVLLFWSGNEELKKIQQEKWSPILSWLKNHFSVNMEKTYNIDLPEGNKAYQKTFEKIINSMDCKSLTAFYLIATRTKSPLIAIAMINKKISPEEAFDMSYLEEIYQSKKWGIDEKSEKIRKKIASELKEIYEYMDK